jgi:hypothetical protein
LINIRLGNLAESLNNKPANTACSGRVGVAAIYKHFPSFKSFLPPGRVHAHHPPLTQTVGWLRAMSQRESPVSCYKRLSNAFMSFKKKDGITPFCLKFQFEKYVPMSLKIQ